MFKRVSSFIKEVRAEMKKVSWSSKDELLGSTGIVIITVFLLAAFIGFCDFLISKLITLIIR